MDKKEYQYKIAERTGATPGMISHLIKGRYKTTNIPLAIAVSEITGKKPIDHISNRVRSLALAAHPELDKKIKKAV